MDYRFRFETLAKSTAVAIGCAGLTFWVMKYKLRHRNASEAFTYLTIKTVTTEESCKEVVKELRRY